MSEPSSERCPFCNASKPKTSSFCSACWYSLPWELRMDLYHRFGEGYEEALAAAKEWLRKEGEAIKAGAK
jgi:hypothetical protein